MLERRSVRNIKLVMVIELTVTSLILRTVKVIRIKNMSVKILKLESFSLR
jgi:hypothetical protein